MTIQQASNLLSEPALPPAFLIQRPGEFLASSGAAGPWSPGHCHGGAPAALITRLAENVPTLVPMEVTRLSVELFRPVPTSLLTTCTVIVREGKKLQLVTVHVDADGVEVARGTVLKLRKEQQDVPPEVLATPHCLPDPDGLPKDQPRITGGFASQFELRVARGAFRKAGPATIWFRLIGTLFSDCAATPTQIAPAIADFSNGASTVLPFTDWTFLNADLSINFFRAPQGEWIAIDAETHVGPQGRALATSRLADERGWFGQATQSLLLQHR